MRFTILGAGALGGYYGAMIARNGDTVRFVARSETEVLRQCGLKLDSMHGEIHIEDPEVYGPGEVPPECDCVIVTCKTTSTAELLPLIPQCLKPGGVVVTLQNGLGVEEPLRAYVDDDHLLSGTCFLCAERVAAGQIRQRGGDRITLGYLTPLGHVKAERILAHLHHGGIDTVLAHDVNAMRWEKLLWNIPFSGLATRENKTVDLILDEHADELRSLLNEVLAAGQAVSGWKPAEDLIEKKIAATGKMGDYAPSMLLDRRAGRSLEWRTMFAEPVRVATEAGLKVPSMSALSQAVAALSR